MKTLLTLAALGFAVRSSNAADFRTVPSSASTRAVTVDSAYGDRVATQEVIRLEGKYSSGKKLEGDLLVIFDASSKLYSWQYIESFGQPRPDTSAISGGPARVFAAQDRLFVFYFTAPELWVREFARSASNLEDAMDKALREISDNFSSMETQLRSVGFKDARNVRLPQAEDLFGHPQTSGPRTGKLTGVARRDDHWELLVEGRWKAKFILNDKYEAVSWQKVP